MIKPDGLNRIGEIVSRIEENGITIGRMKMRKLDSSTLRELLKTDDSNISHISSGNVVGMELIGKDVIQNWLILQGPDDAT